MHLLFAVTHYVVTTLAGQGTSGVRDGSAATAQFMKPMGIAIDAEGNVIVADAAAQRIRMISPSGYVSTIAGSGSPAYDGFWVPGSYRDGPAATAQFNRPTSVAVGADGAIYVADSLNHCIRVIRKGMVSTYAGAADGPGREDGPIANAAFHFPRLLRFDANGDLYVVDYSGSIRRIHNSVVSSLSLERLYAKDALSIAFSGPATNQTMYVGTPTALSAFDTNLHLLWTKSIATYSPVKTTLYTERGTANPGASTPQSLGPAFDMIATGGGEVTYADTQDHAIRAFESSRNIEDPVFPRTPPDASDYGGGYRDGPLEHALFDAPMGLAVMRNGSIAVADTGNRRIRLLRPQATRSSPLVATPSRAPSPSEGAVIVAGEDPFKPLDAHRYRIAYIGNSYVFFNTTWDDSIPGRIERGLQANWKSLGFPLRPQLVAISPIADFDGISQYIEYVLAVGVVDAVILQINGVTIDGSFPVAKGESAQTYQAEWIEKTRAILLHERDVLRANGIPLVVVVNPIGTDLSPLDTPVIDELLSPPEWRYLDYGPPAGRDREGSFLQVFAGTNLDSILVSPAFLANEQSAQRLPLFGTYDGHYSQNGRALAAQTVLDALIARRFWQRPVSR